MDVKKYDVYLCDIKYSSGSVQQGKRPVVVIQNDIGNNSSQTYIVVPLTSEVKKLQQSTHVFIKCNYGLDYDSMFLAEQIITVSEEQLVKYIGHVDNEYLMKQFDDAVAISLGIKNFGKYGRYALIKTLCPKCLEYYKNKQQFSIVRVDNFQKHKKQCDYHKKGSSVGYDYFLIPVSKKAGEENER